MKRKFGILMPVFSLDSGYGTGTFGKAAYDFVDFLAQSGVAVWQVLPLCFIGAGGSPYSSPVSDAISPYFIDPEILVQKGLLTQSECDEFKVPPALHIDYVSLKKAKKAMLKKAFKRFDGKLCQTEYAIYCAIKASMRGKPWYKWGELSDNENIGEYARTHQKSIEFYAFVMAEAEAEWMALKAYAGKKGVVVVGDIPFYVAYDSADVWMNRKLFQLDGVTPTLVAGVPPDYFSKTGQLWGNPVYDWHKREVFTWYSARIARALTLYDAVRLDHFRAFDEYYAIPSGSRNAAKGSWKAGPGFKLFEDKTHLPIIAEDLGFITASVRRLLGKTGYPGMSVLQFGFDGSENNPHLPSNVGYNRVCYTGTHDNMTLKQFVSSVDNREKLVSIVRAEGGEAGDDEELVDSIIELGCATDAQLFVVPLFDLLHKGSEYRINTPSTVSPLNWSVILNEDYRRLKGRITELIKRYNRQNS